MARQDRLPPTVRLPLSPLDPVEHHLSEPIRPLAARRSQRAQRSGLAWQLPSQEAPGFSRHHSHPALADFSLGGLNGTGGWNGQWKVMRDEGL